MTFLHLHGSVPASRVKISVISFLIEEPSSVAVAKIEEAHSHKILDFQLV